MSYNRYRNKSAIVSNSRIENNRFSGVVDLDAKLKDGPQYTNTDGNAGLDYKAITTQFNSLTLRTCRFSIFKLICKVTLG